MKKLILTACVMAYSLTSNATVIWGKYVGLKKVKGVVVINCKAKKNSICTYIIDPHAVGNDTGNWIVTAKDEFENTVYESQCSAVYADSDGAEGTIITAIEVALP